MPDGRHAESPRELRERMRPNGFAAIAITFELLLVPAAWMLAWIWPGEEIPAAEWDLTDAGRAVLATLPPCCFLALATWTRLRQLRSMRRIRAMFRRSFGETIAGLQLWQIIAISAAAGLGEEVLFRGALQSRAGLVPTSIVFGAVHWVTPTYFVFATLMGAYLGWLFETGENLLIPITVHALYDAAALVIIRQQLRSHGLPRQRG